MRETSSLVPKKKIWIDLTNSPHVLVFRPLIELLRADGHEVEVTARDFAQTIGLCQRFGIEATVIGHHRGGGVAAKSLGLAGRSFALWRWARGRNFELALGHGSNDITVAAKALRIPSATMFDYEFARVQHSINCRLARRVVVPEAIPAERLARYGAKRKVFHYPGLKEEYYLADFEREPAVLKELDLDPKRPLVVVRTAPEVALYHRFTNDIQADILNWLKDQPDTQVVLLPRTEAQRDSLEVEFAGSFKVPGQAVDAQSLIAYADLLIGAGGTMNREAVALGTPVYSTFQGRLGAVDELLIQEGRLRLLNDVSELKLDKKSAERPERRRRDPRLIAEILLGAAGD